MALGPRLQHTQKQRLALSQGMRHALETLAMSAEQLREELDKAAAANPLLTLTSHQEKPTKEDLRQGKLWPETANAAPSRYRPWFLASAGSSFDVASLAVAHGDSLSAQVLRQITRLNLDERGTRTALALLDGLEPTGYLGLSIPEVARDLGLASEEVERCLGRLQTFEPAGLFARNLSECLALQLRAADTLTPLLQQVLDHLDLLAEGRLGDLAHLCQVEESDILSALSAIRRLNPKPGLTFSADLPPPPVDLIAQRDDRGKWRVQLNPDIYPQVEVADLDDLARDQAQLDELKQRAQDWRQAVTARGRSLLLLGEQLVNIQGNFLLKGEAFLRPLSQRDMAGLLDLHPATISRLVRDKSISTPKGVMPLVQFFSTSVPTKKGPALSSAQVKRLLADYFTKTSTPTQAKSSARASDQQVTELLHARGIMIARRTVAKYRKELKLGAP